jgi:hypothetical protein
MSREAPRNGEVCALPTRVHTGVHKVYSPGDEPVEAIRGFSPSGRAHLGREGRRLTCIPDLTVRRMAA